MSKTLEAIRALPHVDFVDDERAIGNSIIVTLAAGWEFVAEPGCGVRGFDTVSEARQGCGKGAVRAMAAAPRGAETTGRRVG